MTAAEFLVGITVGIAIAGAGLSGRWLLRNVLDPAAQAWITRVDAAAGRISRGLASHPSQADWAPTARPTRTLAAHIAHARPVALR